jgi:CubicO group peptidase (beta-lactamase class C family)
MLNDGKKWTTALLCILLFFMCGHLHGTAQVEEPQVEDQRLERLERRLEQLRKDLKTPALSAAVVKDQNVLWAKGFGFADLDKKIPAAAHTPYRLASVTKTFGSTILLQLVDQGKVNLDDPVEKYGIKLESEGIIRVKHIFSHTSEYRPGRFYRYNGNRFVLLGDVMEKATGESFGSLLEKNILVPLGMTETAYSGAEGIEKYKPVFDALAKPYKWTGGSGEQAFVKDSYPDHFSPSGGMIASVLDMAKYDIAISQHKFLDPKTRELAFTPFKSTIRKPLPYGLGWFTQEYGGLRLVWHYGYWRCISSLILKVPDRNLTFIIMTNTDHLSNAFPLGGGDVLDSPAALLFLKTFIYEKPGQPPLDINWQSARAQLAGQLQAIGDEGLIKLAKKELKARASMYSVQNRKQRQFVLYNAYADAFCQPEKRDPEGLELLARIGEVKDEAYERREFSLAQDSVLRVYAVGEGSGFGMTDFAGIEDVGTGELVWVMNYYETEAAGGAKKNRKVDIRLPLKAGRYRLHFKSDKGHCWEQWNDQPPGDRFWGAALYRETNPEVLENTLFWEDAADPGALGWSTSKLEQVRANLDNEKTTALMIVTKGKVVFRHGLITNNLRAHSMRKSLISALFGIYIDENKIDLSATIADLGIDERVPLTETEKQATVKDLLSARSGIYIPAAAESQGMRDARPKRGSHEPDSHWYYNNWDFNVLGTVFRQETGGDIYDTFIQRIAGPLKMNDFRAGLTKYYYEDEFSKHPAYPFRISARDLARFGWLYLQKGKWKGKQVMPENWVKESTAVISITDEKETTAGGYGYLWWVTRQPAYGIPKGSYMAWGYGGHRLSVFPTLETVIVHRASTEYQVLKTQDYDELLEQILAAYSPGRTVHAEKTAASAPVPAKRLLDEVKHYTPPPRFALSTWHKVFLWVFLFFFILALTGKLPLYILNKIRKIKPEPAPGKVFRRWAWITNSFMAVFSLLWLALLLKHPIVFRIGLPDWHVVDAAERPLLLIPYAGVLLGAVVVVFGFLFWKNKISSPADRWYYSFLAGGTAMFIAIQFYWNLIRWVF